MSTTRSVAVVKGLASADGRRMKLVLYALWVDSDKKASAGGRIIQDCSAACVVLPMLPSVSDVLHVLFVPA